MFVSSGSMVERQYVKLEIRGANPSLDTNFSMSTYIPGEPTRARLLTALTVINSYVMTLPHVEYSFRAFAVSITYDVHTEFKIHV